MSHFVEGATRLGRVMPQLPAGDAPTVALPRCRFCHQRMLATAKLKSHAACLAEHRRLKSRAKMSQSSRRQYVNRRRPS